jgi:hypothetical protein
MKTITTTPAPTDTADLLECIKHDALAKEWTPGNSEIVDIIGSS